MATKFYGELEVPYTDGESERLDEILQERIWIKEHSASIYFGELKSLRNKLKKLMNLPIM